MHYILIVMLFHYAYSGVATSEFNTQTACESARTTLLQAFHNQANEANEGDRGDVWCVPKG
jgi:hypothetical protein